MTRFQAYLSGGDRISRLERAEEAVAMALRHGVISRAEGEAELDVLRRAKEREEAEREEALRESWEMQSQEWAEEGREMGVCPPRGGWGYGDD